MPQSSLINPFKTRHAKFLVENLNLAKASGVDDAKWEHFQIDHLNDASPFRIEAKSRQIAWSFLSAMEAVGKAVCYAKLENRTALFQPDSIFVSINHEESKEKIRYAKAVYENLEIGGLPKLVTDNQLELEWENGSRITSLPSKGPRGRAKANVFLDEFAHVQHDRTIYTAAIPIISKGGVLRIGSSTLGSSGVFYDIFSDVEKYSGYRRKKTPWWEVQAFCQNIKLARQLAPKMSTSQRVDMFGNDRIKAIFANLPEEDFQQEYEAVFVDEATAWITWDEIHAAEAQGNGLDCQMATGKSNNLEKVFEAIFELQRLIQSGAVENVLALGMDIGRTRHTTEIFLVGCSNLDIFPLRLALTLDGCTFDQQFAVLSKVLEVLPVKKGFIDRGGLGMNIAENAGNSFPAKAEGVNFTLQSKQLWATDAKMLIQQRKTPLPRDTDLAYQIHSIKRIVTPNKNVVFDTVRNEKHHADKFWAWALALAAAGAKPVTTEDDYDDTVSEFWG